MNIISEIMQGLICVLEAFIWWRLNKSLLELKYDTKYLTGAAVMMFFIVLAKTYLFRIPELVKYQSIGTLVLLVYAFFMVMILFKNSLIEKLVWWVVFYLGLIIMELVTILMLSLVMNKSLDQLAGYDNLTHFVIFLFKILTVLLFEAIIRLRKGKIVIGFTYFRELAIIILFNLVLLLWVIFVLTNLKHVADNIENVIIFFFAIVLLITLYSVALIFRIEKKSKEEMATQLKLQQIELELKLNDDIISIMDKLRELRHDMNNHMGIIKTLVHTDRVVELKEYIDQVYEDVEVANELVITGNKTLTVLLNAKKSLAKEKNIEFQSVIATQDIKMKNKDICALIGNILDNAIESAEKAKSKKYIELSIQNTEAGCIITCENSLGTKPVMKKDRFITLKDNTLLHGIGTENIKEIVARYHGEVHFDYDDEMFNVRVVVPE